MTPADNLKIMAPPDSPLPTLFQEATQKVSRSNALGPLLWLVAILVSGTVTSAVWKAPAYVTIGLFAVLCVASSVFLGLYIYFAIFKENLLRSERHDIQRMAMEAVLGDDEKGFRRMVVASVLGGDLALEKSHSLDVTPKAIDDPPPQRKPASRSSKAAKHSQSPEPGEASPS